MVVDLDLANRPVPVFVTDIRAGRYEKITFEIHKPEDNETVSDADFKEGTSGDERFSVVVRGRYDGNPFTFKSREATYQRIDFPNDLVLANPDTTIEVALVVDVNDWFLDDNGLTLNPFDADDRDEIDEAIKRSIRRQQ